MEEKTKEIPNTAPNPENNGIGEEKKVTITLREYEILRTENVKSRDVIYNLREQLNQFGEALNEKRVSYMLRVLENATRFDDEFVKYCANEIKEALYIEKKVEEKEPNE